MKSILLIERKEVESEYGILLIDKLMAMGRFVCEKSKQLIIPTNIALRSQDPIFTIFNLFLRKLAGEQTIQIRIQL